MRPRLPMPIGRRFNDLILVKEVGDYNGYRAARFRCSCGKAFTWNYHQVKTGCKKHCGCKTVRGWIKHGYHGHPLYTVWGNMIDRCYNPKAINYHLYGKRGIKVCKAWHISANFFEWAKNKWKPDLVIDRENNDGNYTPNNCRFVTRRVSSNNRRVRSRPSRFPTLVCHGKAHSSPGILLVVTYTLVLRSWVCLS